MTAGATIRICRAHEMSALSILEADLGWEVLTKQAPESHLVLTLVLADRRVPIAVNEERKSTERCKLSFDWPQEIILAETFDLELTIEGAAPLTLGVGLAANMGSRILPLVSGVGIEVGPGLRPQILPTPKIDVTYVEEHDPREWLTVYSKKGRQPEMPPQHVLERYVQSSAVALDNFKAESMDFIYSHHVFEHLPNPLQVLRNWLRITKPNGIIAGVVPDARFSFDCRQNITSILDFTHDEERGGHEIPLDKYEKWCRHTEPRHTPEDLMKRGYSIHVSYFTPQSFRAMAAILENRGLVDRVFIFSAPNNKDFAFVMRKNCHVSFE